MTLGQKIRAARLCWHHAPRHGAMVRVRDLSSSSFLVELWPDDQIVPRHHANKEFRDLCGVADEIMDKSPVLRGIRKIKKGFAVVLNWDGERLAVGE